MSPVSEYDDYELPKDKFAIVSILRAADSMLNCSAIVDECNFSIGKILI